MQAYFLTGTQYIRPPVLSIYLDNRGFEAELNFGPVLNMPYLNKRGFEAALNFGPVLSNFISRSHNNQQQQSTTTINNNN